MYEAKRFAEALAMAYHRYHGVNTKIVRIFNTYVPRMRPNGGRAIPTFIPQALKNEPITIFVDGSQTRSFCYVDDLMEGIYRLLMSNINDPINIGNPHEMTVKEMAEMILKVTQSNSELIYKPLLVDDLKVRQPNITRAKKYLEWQPKIDLEEGLIKTVAWFKTQKL